MRVGKRVFAPSGSIVALYGLVTTIMLGLGVWQLVRADEKNAMLLAAKTAAAKPAVDIQTVAELPVAAARYERVRATGEYLHELQFLWDNRVHRGRAGYEVLTPLQLSTGEVLLVKRADLPDTTIDNTLQAAGVHIEGALSNPSRGFASGPAFSATARFPKVLQYIDYAAVSGAIKLPVLPVLLQPLASQANAATLELVWQPTAFGPERHYGYAFQWFAMAVALTCLFVFLNLQPARVDEHGG